MRQLTEFRGGALRPVGAVVCVVSGTDARIGIEGQVVERPDGTRRLARGPRTRYHLHRRFARTARAREVGGKRLLVAVHDLVGLCIRPRIDAGDRHDFHQVDDLAPASFVEAKLQHVARRVAAGAVIHENLLGAGVVGAGLGQCRNHHLAGQLAEAPLGIGHLLQREIPAPRRGQFDGALTGFKAERLRPHAVLARAQGREKIISRGVRIDAGGNGRALEFRGYRDTFQLLAGLRCDRAAQQLIGSVGCRHHEQSRCTSQEYRLHFAHRDSPFCGSFAARTTGTGTVLT